jgi:hypothetical protein
VARELDWRRRESANGKHQFLIHDQGPEVKNKDQVMPPQAHRGTAAKPGARTFLSAATPGRLSVPSARLFASNAAADRNVRAPAAVSPHAGRWTGHGPERRTATPMNRPDVSAPLQEVRSRGGNCAYLRLVLEQRRQRPRRSHKPGFIPLPGTHRDLLHPLGMDRVMVQPQDVTDLLQHARGWLAHPARAAASRPPWPARLCS